MANRQDWEYEYQLHVDGEPTKVHLLGNSKTKAYKMLEDQWKIVYPGQSLPKRFRCKLETIAGPYPV